MNKIAKVSAAAFVAAVAAVAAYNSQNNTEFTDLQNENLKALAKQDNDNEVIFDGTKESPWPHLNMEGERGCSGVNGDCHF